MKYAAVKTVLSAFAIFSAVFLLFDASNLGADGPVSQDNKVLEEKKHEKIIGDRNLANLEAIRLANSHPLPERFMPNKTAADFCDNDNETLFCMPAFKKFEAEYRVAPQYGVAACVIQKSMSTVMTAIFCYLSGEKRFTNAKRNIYTEWKPNRFCAGKNEHSTFNGMKRRFKAQANWTYTMVTRDPIERFLSGFVDKCIRKPQGYPPCFNCGSNLTCFVINEYNRMYDQVKKGHFWRSFEDRHFFPQNWRCDLANHFDKYKFIRYSADPSASLMTDLFEILKTQNVPQASLKYIRDSLTTGRTLHSTVQSDARTIIENRLFSSPFLMEYVIRMFYHDFRLFGYPLPENF